MELTCKECIYWNWAKDFPDEGYSNGCNWQSRCPGDVPPCEEEDY